MGDHRPLELCAMMIRLRRLRTATPFAALALMLAACAPASTAPDLKACAGYQPAMDVSDKFLAAFNQKDMAALEKTFHFPHMRIASYPLVVWTGPGQQDDVFGNLGAENWARSAWTKREIIQCSATKAHMLATFARFHPDGSQYAAYDGLYVIELRDGFWGITARSTFAP
jgi:hypothetical protein